ncbi:MAG TPA: hypothetical protein VH857_11580 [Actinomycetes bacterium]|jgi:hypothetical protein|nr:hypothetical protein [Actinomycetes bacterium]
MISDTVLDAGPGAAADRDGEAARRADAPFDDLATAAVVVSPDQDGPGSWAGAPCALRVGSDTYLAYRLRRPVGQGRGWANVVARSADGLRFDPVCQVGKDTFEGDSIERPALVRTPKGRWRLYVSVATPGTKHWRVDLLEASTPEGLADAGPRTVMAGSDRLAVKDPVVVRHEGRWHAFASCHPLDDPQATDRMTTGHATSDDGVGWTWHGTALAGRPGAWDARGVRVAWVRLTGNRPLAWYDGRATAEQNWEECTGLATLAPGGPGAGPLRFAALDGEPVGRSPYGLGGARYVTTVDAAGGGTRFYLEVTRPDGAHDLRTVLVPGG